jgi:hypothetical protein
MALNTEATPVRRSRMVALGLKMAVMENSFKTDPEEGLMLHCNIGRVPGGSSE